MLDSFDLAHALEFLGFNLEKDTCHMWGFFADASPERVFVKSRERKYEETDFSLHPAVKKQPLVLPKNFLDKTVFVNAISNLIATTTTTA